MAVILWLVLYYDGPGDGHYPRGFGLAEPLNNSLVDAAFEILLERLFDAPLKSQASVSADTFEFAEQGQSRVAKVEFDIDKLAPTLKRSLP